MATLLLPRLMSARVGGYAAYILLVFLLCLSAFSAQADQLASLTWNCWVGGQDPLRISCIHERSQPLPKNAPEDTDIELENQLLGQLHEKSRHRNAAVLEGLEWKSIEILHKGAQWTIQVSAYPAGASLGKKQIAKVANAALCPTSIPCTVKVRKPILRAIPGQGE